MKLRELKLKGTFEVIPQVHKDNRGFFFEAFSSSVIPKINVNNFKIAQINVSKSIHGTIRGIHFSTNPSGQAKYVQCVFGEVLDVIVDLRLNSTTFGMWELVKLTEEAHNAVFIPNGFGHGFQTLTASACVMYCVDQVYNPLQEHSINPFAEDLGIKWEPLQPILSERDQNAKSLGYFVKKGLFV